MGGKAVQKTADEQAREIGVEVVDVRQTRVDLVDEVSERDSQFFKYFGSATPLQDIEQIRDPARQQ